MTAGLAFRTTVYITAMPERVWEGVTEPDFTRQWYFEASVESSWKAGSPIVYMREGAPLFDGTVVEVDAPHRLTTTFRALFHPQAREERPCRVTWQITPIDDDVRLAVTYDDIDEGSTTAMLVQGGLAYQLNVLKALVETGRRPPIGNVTFDCADPACLAQFWSQVTGYAIDGMGDGWAGLHDPRGTGPRLLFIRVPEPKTVKNRVHLDIRVVDREAEATRLVGLGAQRLRDVSEGQSWIVMADPEGNEFCVA